MNLQPPLRGLGSGAALLFTMAGAHAASISGSVFFDLNGNGARDAVSEYGLPQWSLQLLPVSPPGPALSASTDANGLFAFNALPAGSYTLSAVMPSPWLRTFPAGAGTHAITLAASDTATGRDFGCKQPARVPQIQWQKSFGGSRIDGNPQVRQTADGGYIMAATSASPPGGTKTSPNYGGLDFWLARFDALGNPLWDRSYGGPGNETLYHFNETPDGGFILAGVSDGGAGGNKTSAHFGGNDCWVVRLDANGDKLWENQFGGSGDESFYSVNWFRETSDGGFILAGRSDSGADGNKTTPHFGGSDVWIVRIDPNGHKLWDRSLGGTGTEAYAGVRELRNGDFLVWSTSYSAVSGNAAEGNKTAAAFGDADVWLVRLDANGNKLWDFAYGGTAYEDAEIAVENPDGTILIEGESGSGPASGPDGNKTSPLHGWSWDCWLLKIDGAGSVLWDKSFGGSGLHYNQGFIPTPDGGGLLKAFTDSDISGNKTSPARGGGDGWVVRVDRDGNKLWDQTYGGVDGDVFYSWTALADGRVLLAGISGSGIGGNKVSPSFNGGGRWLMLADAAGNPVWDQGFGGEFVGGGFNILPTRDGGVLLTDNTSRNGGNVQTAHYGDNDILLIKLAPFSCTANPVTIVVATADCGPRQVTVHFSAALDPATALSPTNYTLAGGAATVQAANFGASTLEVVLDVAGLAAGVTYTLAAQNLLDDCGNALAPNTQITVACPGEIRGKVFNDRNNNCVADAAEFNVIGWPVKLEPGPRYTLTDRQGNYSFAVPAGRYTVSAPSNSLSPWNLTCPAGPGTHSVSVTNGQIVAGTDFGVMSKSLPPCADLWVDVDANYPGFGASTPCCGANFIYTLKFGNNGAAPSTTPAEISFYLPFQCTYVNATPISTPLWTVGPPIPSSGDPVVVLFNQSVPASGYQDSVDIEVSLDCDPAVPCEAPEQELLAGAVFTPLLPSQGECLGAWNDNYSDHTVSPCCSFDPNDCTVEPKGCGPEGYVNRDQALTYLIRFQNIGGGRAHLVTVRNEVDEDLDLNTLEILGSSHPNLLERNGRELKWVFPEIELASAGVDEPASHGYVKYRLRPRAEAPAGAVINNSAEIFFDYNAPISTISTTNTITDNPLPVATFRAAPQRGSAGFTNDFTYTGGTPGAQFRWSFGPHAIPQSSTETNPTGVVFTRPGRHLVSLRVADGDCVVKSPVKVLTVGQRRFDIARAGADVALTWQGDGFIVQETDSLTAPIQWQPVSAQPIAVGGWNYITTPAAAPARFYRLGEAP